LERGFKNSTKASDRRARSVLKAEALQQLIKPAQARAVLLECSERDGTHIDVQLALANLETDVHRKLQLINAVYQQAGLAELCLLPDLVSPQGKLYELLSATEMPPHKDAADDFPLVSVIIPVFNAQNRIATTLRSLLAQSWPNIEILVVDDCSTDQTLAVVNQIALQEPRISIIAAEANRGPYAARNRGLRQARGCHDADDWSHPAKLEIQIRHLIANPGCIGNTSQQARLTEDLVAYRRTGNLGFFNQQNLSSFMFRREPVLQHLGFWDCARFGADGEFIRRVVKVFGTNAVEHLDTVPLSFQRQSAGSLTSSDYFGFDGFLYGARREQFNWYRYNQRTQLSSYYPENNSKSVVPLPEPCWPEREVKAADGSRYFDVVIASDFRLSGGSTISNLEEIKAQRAAGLRTAVMQLYRYDFDPERHLSDKLRELIDNDLVHLVVYGEKIRTQHLIVRYPPVLQFKQKFLPQITADRVSVIINQPPMSDYGSHPVVRYDLVVASRNLQAISTAPAIWYPIGPLVRESIEQYHAAQLSAIQLSEKHWFNIIDLDEWYRGDHIPNSDCPVIGRHSRDH
ncbi:MAG: glycosyltransferase family 2 protein, partial [Pararheinheimera sp.]|nr:glycosyltransferase family 2 protein [Rheinheimera sp.]